MATNPDPPSTPSTLGGVGPMPPIDEETRQEFRSQADASPNPVRNLNGSLTSASSSPGSAGAVQTDYLVPLDYVTERQVITTGTNLTREDLLARQDYERLRIAELQREITARSLRQENIRYVEVDRKTAERWQLEASAEQSRLREELRRLEIELEERRRNYERQELEVRHLRNVVQDRPNVVVVHEAASPGSYNVRIRDAPNPPQSPSPVPTPRAEADVPLVTPHSDTEYGYQGEREKRRTNKVLLCLVMSLVAIVSWCAAYHFASEERAEYESHIGFRKSSFAPSCQQNQERILFIGIPSPASHFEQRLTARRKWVYRAHEMFAGRVNVLFFIGELPMPTHVTAFQTSATTEARAKVPVHSQAIGLHGRAALEDAQKTLEQRLQDEAYLYNDIHRIPVLESASQDEDVLLWILRAGVEWQARFVVKAQEDRVVAVKDAIEMLQKREVSATPAYFGKDWTTNTVLEADGEKSSYYTGECFGVSADLACGIAVLHLNHSVGYPLYGSSNADVNVAKWVQHEASRWLTQEHEHSEIRHNRSLVENLWFPDLCKPYERPPPKQESPANPCATVSSDAGATEPPNPGTTTDPLFPRRV